MFSPSYSFPAFPVRRWRQAALTWHPLLSPWFSLHKKEGIGKHEKSTVMPFLFVICFHALSHSRAEHSEVLFDCAPGTNASTYFNIRIEGAWIAKNDRWICCLTCSDASIDEIVASNFQELDNFQVTEVGALHNDVFHQIISGDNMGTISVESSALWITWGHQRRHLKSLMPSGVGYPDWQAGVRISTCSSGKCRDCLRLLTSASGKALEVL